MRVENWWWWWEERSDVANTDRQEGVGMQDQTTPPFFLFNHLIITSISQTFGL
jgi:hypothetical protein